MKGLIGDIEQQTEENRDFRRVLFTGQRMQLVVMALQPGEELGEEIHPGTDQWRSGVPCKRSIRDSTDLQRSYR